MIFRRRTAAATTGRLEQVFGPTGGAVAAFVLELIQIAVLAFVIIFITRQFLILPFIVKGASMEPNFHENEYLIVDEVTYRLRNPERGEIVVFHPPGNDEQYYIKRVIGLPGEKVEIRNGKITIANSEYPNGILLSEEYITEVTVGSDVVTLGEGEYYLMGDNRDASRDSRNFGAVPKGNIIGRVWLRGLPFDKAGAFMNPEYNF